MNEDKDKNRDGNKKTWRRTKARYRTSRPTSPSSPAEIHSVRDLCDHHHHAVGLGVRASKQAMMMDGGPLR